jgi:hypothetical protein
MQISSIEEEEKEEKLLQHVGTKSGVEHERGLILGANKQLLFSI